jgi:hypothetical protein
MAKELDLDALREHLLDFMINSQYPHDDLDSLAKETHIERITDLVIDSSDDDGHVTGTSTVEVELVYENEDDDSSTDSFPFSFDITIDEGGKIIMGKTPIDTSSFYAADDETDEPATE